MRIGQWKERLADAELLNILQLYHAKDIGNGTGSRFEYDRYKVLEDYESTIDALLALSLFYRHVIVNLDGAAEFYVKINKGLDKEMPIKIGKFTFNVEERRRIQAVHIQITNIIEKYQITPRFFEFADTLDFLRNCLDLYNTPEYYGEEDSI